MTDVVYTAYMLLFDSLVAFWLGYRNLLIYRQFNNKYSLMYSKMGVWIGISLVLYGMPHIVIPQEATRTIGIFYIIAGIPLFWGLIYPLRSALIIWKLEKYIMPVSVLYVLIFVAFTAVHFTAIPMPEIVNGIIVRNVQRPFDIFFAILLAVATLLPSIIFFTEHVESVKASIKKVMFGSALIMGGIGGLGIVVFHKSLIFILWSHTLLFLAFVDLAVLFSIDTIVSLLGRRRSK